MPKYNVGDYIEMKLDGSRKLFARIKKVNKNGRYTASSYAFDGGRVTGKAKQTTFSDAEHVKKINSDDLDPKILRLIDDKYETMKESTEMNYVELAQEHKPEDFKEAVTGALYDRLRDAISDVRQEVSEGMINKGKGIQKKEPVANKDDLTDKKVEPGTSKASDPKATNPGAMGHVQKDEKKTGGKTATPPGGVNEAKSKNYYKIGDPGDRYDGGMPLKVFVNNKEVYYELLDGEQDFTYKKKTYNHIDKLLNAIAADHGLPNGDAFERTSY